MFYIVVYGLKGMGDYLFSLFLLAVIVLLRLGHYGEVNVLRLEVEKRNTINSNKPAVIDWLYDIISTQIEPAILDEETNFVKQITEFMKVNHETQKLAEQEEWNNFKNT